jgi:hypothetical protein
MIKALADNIGFQADLELRLSILKACLKWRFVIPDNSWKERNLNRFTVFQSIVQELISLQKKEELQHKVT